MRVLYILFFVIVSVVMDSDSMFLKNALFLNLILRIRSTAAIFKDSLVNGGHRPSDAAHSNVAPPVPLVQDDNGRASTAAQVAAAQYTLSIIVFAYKDLFLAAASNCELHNDREIYAL